MSDIPSIPELARNPVALLVSQADHVPLFTVNELPTTITGKMPAQWSVDETAR